MVGFEKIIIFSSFSDNERKNFAWVLTKSQRCCQNYIQRVQKGSLWGKTNSLKKEYCYHEIRPLINFFLLLSKYFRRGCQNCILRVHRSNLREKSFFKNQKFFIIFWQWAKQIWLFYRKVFGGVVKTAPFVSKRAVWERNFLKKINTFFNIFRHSAEQFWLGVEKFLSGLSKLYSTCPERGTVWGKTNSLKHSYNFNRFRFFIKLFCPFVWTIPVKLSKLHSMCQ